MKRCSSIPKKHDKVTPVTSNKKLLIVHGAPWENLLGLPEHFRALPPQLRDFEQELAPALITVGSLAGLESRLESEYLRGCVELNYSVNNLADFNSFKHYFPDLTKCPML